MLPTTLLNVYPRFNERDLPRGALTLLCGAEFVDMVRDNLENENRSDVDTSGSKTNPVRHIRPKASILWQISDDAWQY